MSWEVFEIIQRLDRMNPGRELAVQCAPLITGIKESNLLILQKEMADSIKGLLKDTDISCYTLLETDSKTTFLLYRFDALEAYLAERDVRALLVTLGYVHFDMSYMLCTFKERYEARMKAGKDFPHEMGAFLGYPVEDVRGFIENGGQKYLYSGYWKVYSGVIDKAALFHQYEKAKETLIHMLSKGLSIEYIIKIYQKKAMRKIAAVC